MDITKINGDKEYHHGISSMELETENGQLLKIVDDGGDIRITDRHGNKLLIEPVSKTELLIREGGLS